MDQNPRWDSRSELVNYLLGLEDHQIIKLYRLVAQLDHDITSEDIKKEMEYQYSIIRARFEDGWKRDLEDDAEDSPPAPSV